MFRLGDQINKFKKKKEEEKLLPYINSATSKTAHTYMY